MNREIYEGDVVRYIWSDDHWTSGFDRVETRVISYFNAGFNVPYRDTLEIVGNIHTGKSV